MGLVVQRGPWKDTQKDILRRNAKHNTSTGGGTFSGGTVNPTGSSVITPTPMAHLDTPIGLLNPSVYAKNTIIRKSIPRGIKSKKVTGRNGISKIKTGLRPNDSTTGNPTGDEKDEGYFSVLPHNPDYTNHREQNPVINSQSSERQSTKSDGTGGDYAVQEDDGIMTIAKTQQREMEAENVGQLTTDFNSVRFDAIHAAYDARPTITGRQPMMIDGPSFNHPIDTEMRTDIRNLDPKQTIQFATPGPGRTFGMNIDEPERSPFIPGPGRTFGLNGPINIDLGPESSGETNGVKATPFNPPKRVPAKDALKKSNTNAVSRSVIPPLKNYLNTDEIAAAIRNSKLPENLVFGEDRPEISKETAEWADKEDADMLLYNSDYHPLFGRPKYMLNAKKNPVVKPKKKKERSTPFSTATPKKKEKEKATAKNRKKKIQLGTDSKQPTFKTFYDNNLLNSNVPPHARNYNLHPKFLRKNKHRAALREETPEELLRVQSHEKRNAAERVRRNKVISKNRETSVNEALARLKAREKGKKVDAEAKKKRIKELGEKRLKARFAKTQSKSKKWDNDKNLEQRVAFTQKQKSKARKRQ